MSTIQQLAALPLHELEHRASELAVKCTEMLERPQFLGRDITPDEVDVLHRHKAELEQLRAAIALAEERGSVRERAGLVHQAIETRQSGRLSPITVSGHNLEQLEAARAEYRSLSVIEERATVKTTDMGTATEYAASGLLAPRNLWRASGIPTSEPPEGYKATVPSITLPAGTALVGEGNAHAEFDNVAPDPVTLGRTGAWTDLTTEANISTSLAELQAAHSRIIARDADLALITKLEGADCGLDVDEALVTVAAEAAADVSQLWIVGSPADIASLAGNAVFAATNAADIASYATVYGGARLYPTPAASALTIFHPSSYRAFATRLASGVTVDPTTGIQRFGSWMLLGFGCTLVGSALTVGGGS